MCKYIENEKIIKYEGKDIYGTRYLPDKEGKYPIVIFSHGYNGSGKDFRGYGKFLASNGIASYCYDFCGGSANSRSSLKTTEMTITTEENDLKAVITEIKQWKMIDNSNIFIFGASQGGFVSALTAEDYDKDIAGMILMFPALCIADDWTKKYKNVDSIPEEVDFWGMKLGGKFIREVYKFDVMQHIGGYSKNVLILHGDKDPVVAPSYSFEAAKHYKHVKVEIFKGEGHGFSKEGDNKAMKMVLQFVQDNHIN